MGQSHMAYDSRQVANWFIARAKRDGRVLSIMSLLKLIYFAHGWNLEMRKSPLILENIEAWQYGPVVPEAYNALRRQGVDISDSVAGVAPIQETATISFLDEIYAIYGGLSPFVLSDLTHEPGGPWEIARKLGGWYADIPNDLIQAHFEKKRLEANARQS